MSILFDDIDQRFLGPDRPAFRAVLRADSLVEAAASAFALGRPTEARRVLSEAASLPSSDATQVMSRVLLATFAGHVSARRPGPRERASAAITLVAWGQPFTACSVLLDGGTDAALRHAARSLSASRPSDCALAAVVALHERSFSTALQLLNEAGDEAGDAGLHGVLTHIQTLVGELAVQLGIPGRCPSGARRCDRAVGQDRSAALGRPGRGGRGDEERAARGSPP